MTVKYVVINVVSKLKLIFKADLIYLFWISLNIMFFMLNVSCFTKFLVCLFFYEGLILLMSKLALRKCCHYIQKRTEKRKEKEESQD